MTTISQRAFARRWNVSHTAIQNAVRNGILPLADDGRLDPEDADPVWRQYHEMNLAVGHGGDRRRSPAQEAAEAAAWAAWRADNPQEAEEYDRGLAAMLAAYTPLTDAELDAMLAELEAQTAEMATPAGDLAVT